jgi:hypothetical protein
MKQDRSGKSSVLCMALVLAAVVACLGNVSATEITRAPKSAEAGKPLAGPAESTDDEKMAASKDLDCQLIDFTTARLEHRGTDFILIIEGKARYLPSEIRLMPVMYVMMPDYWQISLVGCRASKPSADAAKPYAVDLIVNGNLGHKGIRLLGAPGNQMRIDLVP